MNDITVKNCSNDSVGYHSDESSCLTLNETGVKLSTVTNSTPSKTNSINNNNNNSSEEADLMEDHQASLISPQPSNDNQGCLSSADNVQTHSSEEEMKASKLPENQINTPEDPENPTVTALSSENSSATTLISSNCSASTVSQSTTQNLFSNTVPPPVMLNTLHPAASALYFRGYDYALAAGCMPQYPPAYNFSQLLGSPNSFPYLRINAPTHPPPGMAGMPATSPQYWSADASSLQSPLLASGITGIPATSVPPPPLPTTAVVGGLNHSQHTAQGYPVNAANLSARFAASVQMTSDGKSNEPNIPLEGTSATSASSQQVSVSSNGSSGSFYTPPTAAFAQAMNIPNMYNAAGTGSIMTHSLPWNVNTFINQAILNNYWSLLNAGSQQINANTSNTRVADLPNTSETSISLSDQCGTAEGRCIVTAFNTGDIQRDERLNLLRKASCNQPSYQIPSTLPCARFFVIKSFNEDDVHRSIKYDIWCSTERGNGLLNAAYQDMEQRGGHVYLLFSVNGSGHFCGMCRMVSGLDFQKRSNVWSRDKWTGEFKVSWLFVKDIPNQHLRHIRLESNENKPVTNSRDCTEILPLSKALQVVNVMIHYVSTSSLLDDFEHYDQREMPTNT